MTGISDRKEETEKLRELAVVETVRTIRL